VRLEGVVLLSGYTARAKAYVQALQHADLVPEMTVLYGDRTSVRPGQGGVMMDSRPGIGTVKLPNLAEPLDVSIHRGDWRSVNVTDSSVNSVAVVARLRESLVTRSSPAMAAKSCAAMHSASRRSCTSTPAGCRISDGAPLVNIAGSRKDGSGPRRSSSIRRSTWAQW
jgi:hypothetical protein